MPEIERMATEHEGARPVSDYTPELVAIGRILERIARCLESQTGMVAPVPHLPRPAGTAYAPGDKHDPTHNELKMNRAGLYCPTRLPNGAWCPWRPARTGENAPQAAQTVVAVSDSTPTFTGVSQAEFRPEDLP